MILAVHEYPNKLRKNEQEAKLVLQYDGLPQAREDSQSK